MTVFWKIVFGLVVLMTLVSVVLLVNNERQEREQQILEATIALERAIDAFEANNFAQSLKFLDSIGESLSNDYRVPFYRGRALIQLKEYEKAVTELEKAFSLNKQVDRIPFALGVLYFKLGNLTLSKGYFHAALQINPANEEAKGLMDKMAALERIQPGEEEAEATSEDYAGPNAHPPMPARPGTREPVSNTES
jgi:tetratricopeptide (TPR) repeat protein